MRKAVGAVAAVACLLTAGCAVNPARLYPTQAPAPVSLCQTVCSDSITLTYLSVSGFVIRHDTSVIMTDPSFTHPSLLAVSTPFWGLWTDTAAVDKGLGADTLDHVKAILVGHSHYDHLLDVPYVHRRWYPDAWIYGSQSTANMLAPLADMAARVQTIANADVGTAGHVGTWFPVAGTAFRVMALASSHAPNVAGYTMANRLQSEPRGNMPRTAYGWPVGETLAYLIDVIQPDGAVGFRMLFESAAADSEFEQIAVLDSAGAHGIDVAIICAGNFGNANKYPTTLLNRYHPKHVIVAHWEDFFRPLRPPFVGIPFNDVGELARRLDTGQSGPWVTPLPGARMVYRYSSKSVTGER